MSMLYGMESPMTTRLNAGSSEPHALADGCDRAELAESDSEQPAVTRAATHINASKITHRCRMGSPPLSGPLLNRPRGTGQQPWRLRTSAGGEVVVSNDSTQTTGVSEAAVGDLDLPGVRDGAELSCARGSGQRRVRTPIRWSRPSCRCGRR